MGENKWILPRREDFEDDAFRAAKAEFPPDTWVYLKLTRQVLMVDEVRPSADGPLVRVHGSGCVPVGELRKATEAEVEAWLNRR